MKRYFLKKAGMYLVIFWGVTVLIFGMMMAMPGDPFSGLMLDPTIPPEYIEQQQDKMGLNDPVPMQYAKWAIRVLHGDMGYTSTGRPAAPLVWKAMKNTFLLTIPSFLLSTVIAVVLGIYSAIYANRIFDKIVTILTFLEVSIPTFFLALTCVKIFGYDLQLLPVSGLHSLVGDLTGWEYVKDTLLHMILPVSILTLTQISSMLRYTRSSLLDVMQQDYIRTAMAKGLTRKQAILRHGVRNALLPMITIFCIRLPMILSGALFTETVFVWPGIGMLNYNSIMSREYAIIIAIATMLAIAILLANLLADLLYMAADPRIRLGGAK